MMDLDHDLAIKVSADLIIKEFECPVCFGTLTDAYSTKCGHVFCKGCIEECLNRRHECPNCKKETVLGETSPNYTLDKIIRNPYIGTVLEEKEKSAREYYENLCNIPKPQSPKSTNPIESVFIHNMKQTFLDFEKYFEDLKARSSRIKQKIKSQDQSPEEIAEKLREIDESLELSTQLIVDSFNKHMLSVSPSPDLLPVRVFIKIPKKNTVMDVYIPVTHTVKDLKHLIHEYFNSKGDQVIEMSEGSFILHNNLKEEGGIQNIENAPIGTYGVVSGNTIFFDGEIVLKSDEPKECFTKGFIKGQGMKTNYFHCFTCNTNWICEPCSQSCHIGHHFSIAVPNHEPTWACCYCVKKNLCRIPNSKKK